MTHQSVTAPLEIYQLHLLLLKINPAIWRRVQMCWDSTLADLHRVIQLAMGWEDEHLNRFFIHAHEYAVLKPGGGWGGDEAAGVKLKDLRLRKGERFVYQYDFGANWLHQIRLEQILVLQARKGKDRIYPFCTAGSRIAPPEGCSGIKAFIDLEPQLHAQIWEAQRRLAQIMAQLLPVLDRNDVSEIGLFRQTHRVELTSLLQQLGAAKFDRTALNQHLQHLEVGKSKNQEQSFEN